MLLCHSQFSFDVFALCSHFTEPSWIWFLTSFRNGQWYAQPVFLRAFFSVAASTILLVRPTNFVHSVLRPTALSRCGAYLSTILWTSQHGLDWLQPNSFLQFFALVFGCPLLQIDHPGLFQQHLLHFLRTDHSHVLRDLPFKEQRVPLRPLDALKQQGVPYWGPLPGRTEFCD